jgi:hypothetical protein
VGGLRERDGVTYRWSVRMCLCAMCGGRSGTQTRLRVAVVACRPSEHRAAVGEAVLFGSGRGLLCKGGVHLNPEHLPRGGVSTPEKLAGHVCSRVSVASCGHMRLS